MDRKKDVPPDDRAVAPSTSVRWGDLDADGAGPESWNPRIEVVQRGSSLVVRATLPGLSSRDVDVSMDERRITIRAERGGTFEWRIPLPFAVDWNACEALFHDGVLEVTIPFPIAAELRASAQPAQNAPGSSNN